MIVRLSDPDDPRLEAYRDIRERDLVGRRGRFVAEGAVVVAILLGRARFAAESVLAAERHEDRIAAMTAGFDGPVYLAPQGVIDQVAGFAVHRGILAIGLSGPPLDPAALLAAAPAACVVPAFVGIANHDNMGGLMRNAAAFGAPFALIDARCCDPLYRKAIRVSAGQSLVVPFARVAGDPLDLVTAHGFAPLALTPAGETDIAMLEPEGRIALFLGAEGPGLPDAILARCRRVRIAIADGVDSLNVAVAAGIALHRLSRV